MVRDAPRGRDGIDAAVVDALDRFARILIRSYGDRVRKLLVFGSRARGEARPDSDVDVAVVLDGIHGRRMDEHMRMADFAYEILVDTGFRVQAHPVTVSEWEGVEMHSNPELLRNIRRDGIRFEAPHGS